MGGILQEKGGCKMKKWKVKFERTITEEIIRVISAETEEEAYEKAEEMLDKEEVDFNLAEETDTNEEVTFVKEEKND